MIPSNELHELVLSDGGKVVADVSVDRGIRATRFDAKSREQATLQLDYPSAGFSGGGWVLSPSGRLLVLHYYSGQSESTFVLLNLSDGVLTIVARPEYQFGEYASYAFSPNEDKMIMALPRTCVDWWERWEGDGLDTADDGVAVFPFATLMLCSTDSGQLHRVAIEIAPAVLNPINKDEYDPDLAPRISANTELTIQLPWASAKLDLNNTPDCVRIPYPPEPVR